MRVQTGKGFVVSHVDAEKGEVGFTDGLGC